MAALAAVQTLARLAGDGAAYVREYPAARDALHAYADSPGGYLAHEFLNAVFAPRYSADVTEEMAE